MTIDLHGLTEQEAIPAIYNGLLLLDIGDYDEIEIITGNGYVLRRVLEEILEEENYPFFQYGHNRGSYTVSKK